ncbi:MAG: AAA family ATPase [Wolbachia sp.]
MKHSNCSQSTDYLLAAEPVNLSEWNGLPPKREWISKDWLSIGSVASISGGDESSSAQKIMTAIATGQWWLGEHFEAAKVYGVFSEHDETELLHRQHKINKAFHGRSLDRMKMVSLFGKENLLMTFDNNNFGVLTHLFYELLSDIESFEPKLVVLDTALDLFGGDKENPSHVKQFVQKCCAHIARKVNCAVLLCKHELMETGAWYDAIKFHMHISLEKSEKSVSKYYTLA